MRVSSDWGICEGALLKVLRSCRSCTCDVPLPSGGKILHTLGRVAATHHGFGIDVLCRAGQTTSLFENFDVALQRTLQR